MSKEQQQSPAQLRAAYEQDTAAFLFHIQVKSPHLWIGNTARSLILRALYDQPFATQTSPNDQIVYDRKWNEFVCLACGTLSYPQDMTNICVDTSSKTTLRAMKRGRTRRRRSSRSKALQYRKEYLHKQRSHGGSNTNLQLRREVMEQGHRMKMASLHRLGDGKSRHSLVTKCGYCGEEKKRKGVEVKVSQSNRAAKKDQQTVHKCVTDRSIGKTIEKQDGFVESNFISFSDSQQKYTSKPNNTVAVAKKGFSCKQNRSPLLSGSTKKAKKKPASSKLMDFLSSLND